MVTSKPTEPEASPPVVTREETQAKIDRFYAAVAAPAPTPNWTVMDAFERVVSRQPAHACLIYQDRTVSYRDVDTLAGRYATLALETGLKEGQVAAVMVENRPEFFAAWMGLAKIGVTAVSSVMARVFEIMVGSMVGTSLAMAPAMLLTPYARIVDLDGPLLLTRDRHDGLRYDGSLVYPPEAALWG